MKIVLSEEFETVEDAALFQAILLELKAGRTLSVQLAYAKETIKRQEDQLQETIKRQEAAQVERRLVESELDRENWLAVLCQAMAAEGRRRMETRNRLPSVHSPRCDYDCCKNSGKLGDYCGNCDCHKTWDKLCLEAWRKLDESTKALESQQQSCASMVVQVQEARAQASEALALARYGKEPHFEWTTLEAALRKSVEMWSHVEIPDDRPSSLLASGREVIE